MSHRYVDYVAYTQEVQPCAGSRRGLRNPVLYELLRTRVGPVTVHQEGQPAPRPRLVMARGKPRSQFAELGEYYACSCPYCNDTKRRLWVNHMWCTLDPLTEEPMRHLAICYNEDCLKGRYADFEEQVFGWRNATRRKYPTVTIAHDASEPSALPEVALPGTCPLLTVLPPEHKARRYLQARGLDVDKVTRTWDLRYCTETHSRYHAQAAGRIIVPVRFEQQLVGWQGRWPGELNWKLAGIPKYYTMPDLKKHRMFYNWDRARRGRLMVIVEGVTDVWQVGRSGVALLGKTLSEEQLCLLATWRAGQPKSCLLVLLLDPDAWHDKDVRKRARLQEKRGLLLERLRTIFGRKGFLEMTLPEGLDPGKLATPVLWHELALAALKSGMDLEDFRARTPRG